MMSFDKEGFALAKSGDFITAWMGLKLPMTITQGGDLHYVPFWLLEVTESLWRSLGFSEYQAGTRPVRLNKCLPLVKLVYDNEELRLKWSSLVALHSEIFREPELGNKYSEDLMQDAKSVACPIEVEKDDGNGLY